MSDVEVLPVLSGEVVEPIKPKAEVRDPWDPLPEETAANYRAFCVFLEMDPAKRTIAAVARKQKVRVRMRQVWSQRFRWRDRALAYDQHQASIVRAGVERQMADLARKRVTSAAKLIDKATREVLRHEGGLSPFESARILEVSTRLGEPKDMVAAGSGGVRLENVLIAVAGERGKDPRTMTD